MPEKSILLSKLEQEMLINPKGLNDRQKRNLGYRLKTKSAQIDQVLQEIKLLVENVSEDSIKENISNETLNSMITIFEKILEIVNPLPIGEHVSGELRAFRVYGNSMSKNPDIEHGECAIDSISYTATTKEIDIYRHLKDHFDKIRYYVDPCTPDPTCHDPDYSLKLKEKIRRDLEETNESFEISFHHHTIDERDKDGDPIGKFFMVDIDKLKEIRFKPAGLKGCMEIPPLLLGAKVPSVESKYQIWEQAHPGAEPYPDRETMWANAKRAVEQEKPK
jgi:hypothetical protein